MEMLKALLVFCRTAEESATCTVKVEEPVALDVPEMLPLLLRDRPVGKEPPVRDQL
jgi:hypothetical protein